MDFTRYSNWEKYPNHKNDKKYDTKRSCGTTAIDGKQSVQKQLGKYRMWAPEHQSQRFKGAAGVVSSGF